MKVDRLWPKVLGVERLTGFVVLRHLALYVVQEKGGYRRRVSKSEWLTRVDVRFNLKGV